VNMKTNVQYVGGTAAGTKENCSEVRTHMRYPIHAPVAFDWLARNGMRRKGKGRSQNISEGGAFVFTRNLPPVGASINLSIQFPNTAAGGRYLRMEMIGEVVRVELPLRRKSNWGFAVACVKRALNPNRDLGEPSPGIQ
jgi:hypothetical protein